MFANKWISNIRTTLTDWLYYYWQQAYICALNVPDLTYVHLKLARFSQMNYICWRHELLVAIEGKTYFWTQMLGIFNDRLLLWSQLKSPLRQPRSHSVLWAADGQQEIILSQVIAGEHEQKGKRGNNMSYKANLSQTSLKSFYALFFCSDTHCGQQTTKSMS